MRRRRAAGVATLATDTAEAVPPLGLLEEDVVAAFCFLGVRGRHVQVVPIGTCGLVLQVGQLGLVLIVEVQDVVGVLVVAFE